jgi:aspartyl-tRNA(Asn)/glutamyl-tRNA(Gln) amidotransferase subunit A
VKVYTSLAEIQRELDAGSTTIAQLVEGYLANIEANAHLNAFLEVYATEARAAAQQLDAQRANGQAGPLAGLVIALKDNIVMKGHRVSASSKILEGFQSLFTATAVERLLAAGAIVIGRTNCDEFAMGSSNENSAFGPVRNPLDASRVPGGSSGGSAAAVAANLCHAALGSDTGGSIRLPASFTGTVGLKPTYGRVSRWGLIAYASSFDQIGPFTRCVEDAARILAVMAGECPHDATTSTRPLEDYVGALCQTDGRYSIGVLRECLESPGLDDGTRQVFNTLVDKLKADGHTINVVDFPLLSKLVPTYYILTTAEASSNLARYDGVRYGYRSPQARSNDELFINSRTEGFGPEVRRRIMLGTFVLSSGFFDAYYTRAMRVRRLLLNQTQALLAQNQLLLSPTTPTPAFELGAKATDPIEMYLSDIFTVHANLVGMPAISLPIATHPCGLPIGIQFLADYFREDILFSFGNRLMPLPQHSPTSVSP